MRDLIDRWKEYRGDARAMGLLVLLITVLYSDVLFLGMNFYTRDLTHYFYPMKWVAREAVLSGEFPFWNRLFSAGQPLAANPAYELFYPPQWLTLLPDYNYWFQFHIVLHVYVAALGAFRFFRSIALGLPASFIGAMVFAMCGPYVSTVNLPAILFALTWVPWIALYARRWILDRRARHFVPAASFLGIQALICEPTTLLQTWGVIGLYAVWTGWREGRLRAAAGRVLAAAGLIGAAMAVAAIQLVPAIDHATDSVRAAGLDFRNVSGWSMSPARVVETVYPNAFGTVEGIHWGRFFGEDEHGYYLYSVYLSLMTVALALAGIGGRVAGRGFAMTVALPSFLIALGSHTPLLGLLHRGGLFTSIRYPEKFILSASFALLVYAVIVLDRVLAGDAALGRRAGWICAVSGAVAALVFGVCLLPGYPDGFAALWGLSGPGPASIARTQWFVAAVRGLAFAVALRMLARDTGRRSLALLAMVLLADLAPLGNQINPRMHRSFLDEPPGIVERLDLGGSRLAHIAAMQGRAPEQERYFKSTRGYWVLRNGLWPSMPALYGIPTCLEVDVDETQLLRTRAVLDMVQALSDRGVYDWYSILAPMYGSGPALVYREPEGELRRVDGDWSMLEPVDIDPAPVNPRYFFASQIVRAESDVRLTDMLASRRWHPRTAFVRTEAWPVAGGRVLSSKETANRTSLEIEADGDAFLVLAATHHKYWRATIDGVRATITETNVAFQGIGVTKGRHRIELHYRNPLIVVSACMTLVSIAGLVLAWRRGAVAKGMGDRETEAA